MKTFKRFFASLMVAVMVLTAAPLSGFVGMELNLDWLDFNTKASAASYSGTCGENLTWSLDTSTCELVISGEGEMTDYSSYSSVPWYSYRSSIKKVTIGDGVTSISDDAFYYCTSLTSIAIPDGVTSIGDYAFYNCTSLTSITIPDSVTNIGDGAFCGCDSLISITIPDSVTSIGYGTFYYCTSLTSIIIPDNVTSISSEAFYNCTSLTSITIPDSVTSIGSSAFSWCTSLTSITIPGSVTNIGNGVFEGCTNLTSITIPDSVTSIGDYAFYNCIGLTSIIIPDSVTSISSEAFYNCTSLTSITIPDSVTSIGDYAFYNCGGLKELTMPISAKIYNSNKTFYGCTNIEKITLTKGDGTAQNYGTMQSSSATDTYYQYTPWYINRSNLKELVIEDGVTGIGSCMFYGCSEFTDVTIPDSVTSIGDSAFYGCERLIVYVTENSYAETYMFENNIPYYCLYNENEDKIISVSVTSKLSFEINKETYTMTVNCNGNMLSFTDTDAPWLKYQGYIKRIIISDGCTSIGDNAFKNLRGVQSVTIPDSVTCIGNRAFYNCSEIKEFTMPISAKIYNSSNTFYGCTNIEKITLTKGDCTAENYGTSTSSSATSTHYGYTPWHISCSSLKELTIEDGVTGIGSYAFYYCSGLTNVIIPDSVTNIGSYAFSYCRNLTSITIPDSVTSIGSSAFNGCTSLTSVTIPDSVTSIGYYAFYGCTGLTSITIPDSVTSIGHYAFYGCTGLTSITIPDSVTSIGSYAFHGCTGLTSITIPDSVTSIGDYVFYGCTGLTSITIGNGVTTIGERSFYNCSNLGNITLPISVQSIGNNAFAGCQNMGALKVYNRSCTFGTDATSYYTTIVGYAGSSAEAYANEMGFNFELIPDGDHEHIYSNSCDNECNICGYINPDAGHTFDNDCDTECNYCGFVRTPNHTDDNNDGLCDVCEKALSDILIGVEQNFKVKAGETVYIKFVPANSGVYTFYSSSSTDTYGYIFDANKSQLASDDDSSGNGNNFLITYTFKSGTVYYLGVRYYSSSNSGEIPVTIRLDELICDHNHTHEEYQDSTCTENGYDKVVCDDCGEIVSTTSLPLLDHDYKTITAPPTCVDEGTVVCLCRMCRDAYISEILDPLGHSELVWVTVKVPSTRNEGIMNQVCPVCGEVFDTKTVPAISLSADSTANIDFETNTISGFDSGSSSIGDYLSATNNGYTFTCDSEKIATGTVITLTAGEDTINEFEAVIFGDTNGDGWYDGQDAIIVDCLANGMLTDEDVGEAVYMAADCNHDGVIDQLDVALLNEAGTLLANVDQSKPTEVLLETSSDYVEYLDLIDQSPEIDVEDETDIPEADVETEDTTPEQDANKETNFFEMIMNFIKAIIEMILSRIPVPYK